MSDTPTVAFDDRVLLFEIDIDGKKYSYDQNYEMYASGIRFPDGNFGEAAVRLDNISKKTRDFIITKTSPFRPQRTTAQISLQVGRKSYGTFQLFSGSATQCSPTQPPDIGLVFNTLNQGLLLTQANAFSAPPMANVKSICQGVAQNLGLTLDYHATANPTIQNYQFTGALGRQMDKLNELGINAFIDNSTNSLVVTDVNSSITVPVVQINNETNMIGVPEITEFGVRVKQLIKNEVRLRSPATVTSVVNPAANGDYTINKLGFEVASRQQPFYWIMDLIPRQNDLTVKQGAQNG